MSEAVDKHLDNAFASLDDLTVRELDATAEVLASQRHPLHEFSSIFRTVAEARTGAGTQVFPACISSRTSNTPTRSSSRGSLMRRRPSGPCALCAGQAASVTPRRSSASLEAAISRFSFDSTGWF